MDKSLIFEEIKKELQMLVENAILSALQKVYQKPAYPERVNVSQAAEITGYTKNTLYQMHFT